MTTHELLTADHEAIRRLATRLQAAAKKPLETFSDLLASLQQTVQKHFRREEVYYRVLDDGKRIQERDLMHTLRNDHAAVIFALESLAIRLRKTGYNPDWQKRFDNLLGVLLPHLDQEEKTLFPKGTAMLSPSEIKSIQEQIEAIE
jgi:hemerythrin superfamily protein